MFLSVPASQPAAGVPLIDWRGREGEGARGWNKEMCGRWKQAGAHVPSGSTLWGKRQLRGVPDRNCIDLRADRSLPWASSTNERKRCKRICLIAEICL